MLTEENVDNSIETLRNLAIHIEAERGCSTALVGVLISGFAQDVMFRCDQEFEGRDTIDGSEILKIFSNVLEDQAADYKAAINEENVDNPPSSPE